MILKGSDPSVDALSFSKVYFVSNPPYLPLPNLIMMGYDYLLWASNRVNNPSSSFPEVRTIRLSNQQKKTLTIFYKSLAGVTAVTGKADSYFIIAFTRHFANNTSNDIMPVITMYNASMTTPTLSSYMPDFTCCTERDPNYIIETINVLSGVTVGIGMPFDRFGVQRVQI